VGVGVGVGVGVVMVEENSLNFQGFWHSNIGLKSWLPS